MARNAPTLVGKQRAIVQPSRALTPESEARSSAAARACSAEPPGGLRILRAGRAPVELELREEERYLLGRHDAADVHFDSEAVSRLHGVIRRGEGGWCFDDYDSSNGSLLLRADAVTPEAITPRRPMALAVGDRIELGTAEASVELIAAPQRAPDSAPATTVSAAATDFDQRLRVASRTKVPVFLFGPSGCGKTYAARLIHTRSSASGPFVPLNCARLPQDASALHSELLGHVKGAFTGAAADRIGRLIHADGGTLFLDEVESLSALGQGFLLDVLEGSGDLSPLGARAPHPHAPIFRLISASKIALGHSGLRDDLCERLAEGHMWPVPTLDRRREDIPGLIAHFAQQQGKLLGVEVVIAEDAVEAALGAPWPGQIRQLKAAISVLAQMAVARVVGRPPRRVELGRAALGQHLRERAQAFEGLVGETVTEPSARGVGAPPVRQKADPRALTRAQLAELIAQCDGNRSEVARRLGISRNTLARKLRDFDLD